MEVLWEMALNQGATSHLTEMNLGKNMRRSGERIQVVKVNLYSTLIFQGQNVLKEKNLSSKNQSLSKNGVNQ